MSSWGASCWRWSSLRFRLCEPVVLLLCICPPLSDSFHVFRSFSLCSCPSFFLLSLSSIPCSASRPSSSSTALFLIFHHSSPYVPLHALTPSDVSVHSLSRVSLILSVSSTLGEGLHLPSGRIMRPRMTPVSQHPQRPFRLPSLGFSPHPPSHPKNTSLIHPILKQTAMSPIVSPSSPLLSPFSAGSVIRRS